MDDIERMYQMKNPGAYILLIEIDKDVIEVRCQVVPSGFAVGLDRVLYKCFHLQTTSISTCCMLYLHVGFSIYPG